METTERATVARYILVSRAGRPMATDVSVQIATEPDREAGASAAADACMAWFDEVDARLSRFRAESELSQLNAADGQWFSASPMLYGVTVAALHAARASEGLFDPTLLPQLEALGYDRDFSQIARRDISADANRSIWTPPIQAWRDIELDPEGQRIRLPAGARLDLGGIAKGWAADQALERYRANFPGALINVGGDLRAHGGPQPGTPWSVGIRPLRAEAGAPEPGAAPWAATITLSRGALASSGAVRRWWRDGDAVRHHLLDPRSGLPMPIWTGADLERPDAPARALAMVTALAPTAERAEVAAKLALLRGYAEAARAVESAWARYGAIGPANDLDASVALLFTFSDGEIMPSANARAWLATYGSAGAEIPMYVSPAGVEPLPPLAGQEA